MAFERRDRRMTNTEALKSCTTRFDIVAVLVECALNFDDSKRGRHESASTCLREARLAASDRVAAGPVAARCPGGRSIRRNKAFMTIWVV